MQKMSRIRHEYADEDEYSRPADNKAARVYDEECWKKVMSGDAGAYVLRKILAETKLYWPSYVRGDMNETIFREGKRNLGLWLLAKMNVVDSVRAAEILQQVREPDYD